MKIAILVPDDRDEHRKYEVPEPYFGSAPTALLEGLSQIPECEVHIVCCVQQPMRSPEKIAPNIYYHSLHVPKWGWLRGGYLGCIAAIRKKLKEIRPDIVHGQGTERYCALGAVFSGFPNVVTIHGNMRRIAEITGAKPFSFRWLNARLEAFTLPRTQGVVCITRYTQKLVEALAPRTWIVPNAVDPRFFEITRKPEPTPVILVVGTVCAYKNQNLLIESLDSLAQEAEFRLRFLGNAGPGEYGDTFRRLIASRPWCEHIGFVDRNALREHLAQASLLMLPSLEDNCPMVILEAMAAGVPVIGAKIGGVPDLINHGVDGIFCDPASPESMRGAVHQMLSERETAEAMACEAKAKSLQRFHPRAIAKSHLEIYREVIGGTST